MRRGDSSDGDWICGLDGCRGGWVAARAPAGDLRGARVSIIADLAMLLDETPQPLFVAVDMPIGLPERTVGGGRAPERLVRPLLGARQSSVFAIPARAAVEAATYAEACVAALATSDPPRKVSKQGFFLFPKIRALDALLRARLDWRDRVREVHPEVAFAALNGGPLPEPKKVKGQPWPAGLDLRRALLARAGVPDALLYAPPPRGAGVDDVLDALACLVTAEHMRVGRTISYPDPPERDAHGLPIAIWAPIPHTRAVTSSLSAMSDAARSIARPLSCADIDDAARRIAPFVRVTPVMELARGALGGDWSPVLKCEFMQAAGSFKPRGAFNNLLSRAVGPAGVAAASGGNHGAAVAYAAQVLGHRARIFVPEISAPAKVAAIRRFGAEVVIGGARYDDAQAACDAYVTESGALKVHPFAAIETIAGQGTLAREWEAQSSLDSVLIAVGGGGLIAGVASWWAGARVKVIGVEPEGSRALHAALAANAPVDVPVESVAADSLGARNVGALVHDICRGTVDHVALVPDEAIVEAQRRLWRDFRIAAEPGGATALAAVLCGAYAPAPGERVGILLCGGNVDLAKLAGIAA